MNGSKLEKKEAISSLSPYIVIEFTSKEKFDEARNVLIMLMDSQSHLDEIRPFSLDYL